MLLPGRRQPIDRQRPGQRSAVDKAEEPRPGDRDRGGRAEPIEFFQDRRRGERLLLQRSIEPLEGVESIGRRLDPIELTVRDHSAQLAKRKRR